MAVFMAIVMMAILPWSLRPAQAAVTGRYVRIDAMLPAMEIAEIEVYSGGANLLRGHPELIADGAELNWYGPVDPLGQARIMTDGSPSYCGIGVPSGEFTFSNAHVEVDLGKEQELEAVVLEDGHYGKSPVKGWLRDEGWRVISVLDGRRQVVCSHLVTCYTHEYMESKGRMRAEFTAPGGAFLGRAVPSKSRGWFTLAEFMLGFLGVKEESMAVDPGREARLAEFAHRNDPDRLAAFARGFFSGVDLSRHGMESIRARLDDGCVTEALDLFKQRLFEKFASMDRVSLRGGGNYEFRPDPLSGALMQAEDQFNYRVVDRNSRKVTIRKPGEVLDFSVMPWGGDGHPRGLLLVYTATKDPKYLTRWAELMDEWAIFYQRWANAGDRREFFPHTRSLAFLGICKDLREAAKLLPGLVSDLPAATLARIFQVISEENPPAYWRLARKTVFNHQLNAWCGAYFDASMLEDFHVGKRLQLEVEQHFQRLWNLGITRDGSMMEVGDMGHLPCPAVFFPESYLQVREDKPAWLTPDVDRWFLHIFRNHNRSLVRMISPGGMLVRAADADDGFARVAPFILRQPWGSSSYHGNFVTKAYPERLAATPILSEREVRAVFDTVYGRGRHRGELSPPRQEAYDRTTFALPGGYEGPPQTLSDYMPYAGLHYLRRGWASDDSFIEMLCQPAPGSANTYNTDAPGSLTDKWEGADFVDTQFKYWDFGEALLLARPLLVDGQSQCGDIETHRRWPGSKTGRLTEAPEKPLPNRFHSSPLYDYQECFYEGGYQTWQLLDENGGSLPQQFRTARYKLGSTGPAIAGVRTTRQILQLRKHRLFVVVDRLRFSDTHSHQVQAWYTFLPKDKQVAVESDAATGTVRLTKPTGPQLTLRQFGPAGLAYGPLQTTQAGDRKRLEAAWPAQGETVLVTLLEPQRDSSTPATLAEVRSLSAGDKVGFTATLHDGEQITFSVPAKLPASDPPAAEQAMLGVRSGNAWSGVTAGMAAVELAGKNVALGVADAEFSVAAPGAQPSVTPIHRPIDPPTASPSQSVFVDKLVVSLVSQTPGVEIRYTTDGSEPDVNSPVYQHPFEITQSCMVQSRAFRPGVTTIPFAIDGTRVSDISYARFEKKPLKPSLQPAGTPQVGLAYDYIEDEWHRLFAAAERLPATSFGTTQKLMDVSMRQTDGTFAVRYQGLLTVPADGVYTFHAPPEYGHCNSMEPGYDLRVIVDGEEWRPGAMWHGLGDWSVALTKGVHRFMVVFADAREKDLEHQRFDYLYAYPSPWVVWRGAAPELLLSGAGRVREPIPENWLSHEAGVSASSAATLSPLNPLQ